MRKLLMAAGLAGLLAGCGEIKRLDYDYKNAPITFFCYRTNGKIFVQDQHGHSVSIRNLKTNKTYAPRRANINGRTYGKDVLVKITNDCITAFEED